MPLVNRTFDQLIDFTRTSAATYVNSSGNIVSTPASVNLLTFTQEFDNSAWTKTNATITANSTTAPDGTMTADTLTASGANGTVLQTFTASAVPYTFSIWLRRLTGTGNVQLTVDGTTFVTVAVTSDWTRFSTTLTPSAGSRTAGVRIVTSGDAVYGWGAQLEQASAATDYTRNFGGLFPPRFDYDPVTLSPRGFLVEEQRTNLRVYSEQFDNAAWAKDSCTISADAAVSPSGATNADKVVSNNATTQTGIGQTFTAAAAVYTASFYVKAAEVQFVQLLWSSTASTEYANFDLSAGTVTQSTGTARIMAAGNGWYRISLTSTLAAVSANAFCWMIGSGTAARAATYAGNGTNGFLVWGAQSELGSFATSYIPTVASQVTRTADDAVIQSPNFSSWYNSVEGTLSIEGSVLATATGNRVAANLHNSASAGIMIGNSAGGSGTDADFYVLNSGDQAWLRFTSAVSAGTVFKISGAYKANDFAASANGATTITDTSGTVPTATSLRIGRNTASSYFNGHIRSIRYYPTRLSNAQLQALSA